MNISKFSLKPGLSLSTFVMALFTSSAFAGTGGSEFKTLTDSIVSYATGYPAMGAIAIGLILGIIRLIKGEAAVLGWTIVAGLVVASLETILNTLVTALI